MPTELPPRPWVIPSDEGKLQGLGGSYPACQRVWVKTPETERSQGFSLSTCQLPGIHRQKQVVQLSRSDLPHFCISTHAVFLPQPHEVLDPWELKLQEVSVCLHRRKPLSGLWPFSPLGALFMDHSPCRGALGKQWSGKVHLTNDQSFPCFAKCWEAGIDSREAQSLISENRVNCRWGA